MENYAKLCHKLIRENKMNKTIKTISIVAILATSQIQAGWFGGFDPTASTVFEQIKQIKQLRDQLNEMRDQTKLFQKELLSATGIRDSVGMFKELKQLNTVMDKWNVDLGDLDIDNPKSK